MKYPALTKQYNLKTRSDLLECDYLHKLNDEEKAFLNKFNEEYVNGVLDRENLENNLHNTEALKKDCDDRNNSRNRCMLTKAKAAGKYVTFSEMKDNQLSNTFEDKIIYQIDIKKKKRRRKKKVKKG